MLRWFLAFLTTFIVASRLTPDVREPLFPRERRSRRTALASLLQSARSDHGVTVTQDPNAGEEQDTDFVSMVVIGGSMNASLSGLEPSVVKTFVLSWEQFLSRVSGARGFGRIEVVKVSSNTSTGFQEVFKNAKSTELETLETPRTTTPSFALHFLVKSGAPPARLLVDTIENALTNVDSPTWDTAPPMLQGLRDQVQQFDSVPIPVEIPPWYFIFADQVTGYLDNNLAVNLIPYYWASVGVCFLVGVAYWHVSLKDRPRNLLPIPTDKAEHFPNSSIFACHQDCFGFLFAMCCPWIRWAATMHLSGQGSFYLFLLLFAAATLGGFVTLGLSLIASTVIGVIYRQRLRALYSPGKHTSFSTTETFMYCCCLPCAVAQEARHVDHVSAMQAMEHPDRPSAQREDAEEPHRPQLGVLAKSSQFWSFFVIGVCFTFAVFGQEGCESRFWFLGMAGFLLLLAVWDTLLLLSASWDEDLMSPMGPDVSKRIHIKHKHPLLLTGYKLVQLTPMVWVIYGAMEFFPLRPSCNLVFPVYILVGLNYFVILCMDLWTWCNESPVADEDVEDE